MISENLESKLLELSGATAIEKVDKLQSLWSGYGNLLRVELKNGTYPSLIVKDIQLGSSQNHPRGWNSNISHERKKRSYIVEETWYHHHNLRLQSDSKTPKCYFSEQTDSGLLIVMEDLKNAGFPKVKQSVNWNEIKACIKWLANFHAEFLNDYPNDLWNVGCYWHLDTRPDELAELDDFELKSAAMDIDSKLRNSSFLTLVHGDAKLANFCFNNDGSEVAAVDFQYVGIGCGMKDLAYFVGSCLYEEEAEKLESEILNKYFNFLEEAILNKKLKIDFNKLKEEWSSLYYYAWADFHRFLKGWSPGHWKINSYSEKVTQSVIAEIKRSHAID